MILDELERLSKAATTGPWEFRPTEHSGGIRFVVASNEPRNADGTEFIPADCSHGKNGKLIAAMRNNIDALIELARSVQAYFDAPFCPSTGDDSAITNAEQKMLTALERLK